MGIIDSTQEKGKRMSDVFLIDFALESKRDAFTFRERDRQNNGETETDRETEK